MGRRSEWMVGDGMLLFLLLFLMFVSQRESFLDRRDSKATDGLS